MRKLSLGLILAILLSVFTFTTVSAETLVAGGSSGVATWKIEDNWYATTSTGANVAVKTAKIVDRDGDNYLELHHELAGGGYGTESAGYIHAYTEPLNLVEGKTYRVEYTASNHDIAGAVAFAVAPGYLNSNGVYIAKDTPWCQNYVLNQKNASGLTVTAVVADTSVSKWYTCNYEFTYTAEKYTAEPRIGFMLRRSNWEKYNHTVLIDDVSLVATDDASKTNLIKNGDFGKDTAHQITNGWHMIYNRGTMGEATVEAKLADKNQYVYMGSKSLGQSNIEGNNALYMKYDADDDNDGGYGTLYAYTDELNFVHGKTYNVSALLLAGDTAEYLKFLIGRLNYADNTFTDVADKKLFHKKEQFIENKQASGGVHRMEYEFTYDKDTMGDGLRFAVAVTGEGWSNASEISVDNVRIVATDKPDTNLVSNGGFGDNVNMSIPEDKMYNPGSNQKWTAVYNSHEANDTSVSIEKYDVGIKYVDDGADKTQASIKISGDKVLKMVYPKVRVNSTRTADLGLYGENAVFSDVIDFENSHKYEVSVTYLSMDAGTMTTSFGLGKFDRKSKTITLTENHWIGQESEGVNAESEVQYDTTANGKYYKVMTFDFTYDEAKMGALKFYAYQRSCGNKGVNELILDDVVIKDKDTGTVIFGGDFEAEPKVSIDETSSAEGAYRLISHDVCDDGKADYYEVDILTAPLGKKAVVTVGGNNVDYKNITATVDTKVKVEWAEDDAKVLEGIGTAYVSGNSVTIFARYTGNAEDYGFKVGELKDLDFDVNGGTYKAAEGKFEAEKNTYGIFGIKLAGLEAGTYTVKPYADTTEGAVIEFTIE